MVRVLFSTLLGLALCTGAALADDKNASKDKDTGKNAGNKDTGKNSGKGHEATITKVDMKNHSLTVKMKGDDGKETEKVFKLTEEVRYVDSTGKVAAADVFKSGDYVLVVEEEGKLKEVRKHDDKDHKGDKGKDKDKK